MIYRSYTWIGNNTELYGKPVPWTTWPPPDGEMRSITAAMAMMFPMQERLETAPKLAANINLKFAASVVMILARTRLSIIFAKKMSSKHGAQTHTHTHCYWCRLSNSHVTLLSINKIHVVFVYVAVPWKRKCMHWRLHIHEFRIELQARLSVQSKRITFKRNRQW